MGITQTDIDKLDYWLLQQDQSPDPERVGRLLAGVGSVEQLMRRRAELSSPYLDYAAALVELYRRPEYTDRLVWAGLRAAESNVRARLRAHKAHETRGLPYQHRQQGGSTGQPLAASPPTPPRRDVPMF